MTSFKLFAIFSIAIAGLCVLVFPLWAIGVPGVADPENPYRRGWTIGLMVISLYPISIVLLYGSNLLVWILSLYNQVSTTNLMRCQQTSTILAIAILVFAVARLVQAFRVMSGN